MSNWKDCTLADLGEIVGGSTPSTKNESYYGGEIAWITPKDLSTFHGRFIKRGERNITKVGLNSCSARLMPQHSVLFTSRAPIGYVAIAQNEVCTNQGFKSIVPNADTDYLFLYYLLVHNRERIENMGSGTTFKEVSGSVMKNITVSVPTDIEEQREISRILGSLDDKIENNTAINHHLEQMAMAIFKSWFVNFEPFDGEIPDDWRTASLREIAEIKHGYAFKGEYFCDEPTPYLLVTPGNFAIGGGFLEKPKYYNGPIPQSFILKQNDLIVTMTDLSKQGDTLGYSALVPASDLYLHNQRIGLVSVEKKLKDFLYWLMRTREYQRFIVNHASGSTVKHTSPKSILSYEFVLPDDSTLETIGPVFRQINELVTHNFTESVRLAALRGALLPRLMSGELSVGDI